VIVKILYLNLKKEYYVHTAKGIFSLFTCYLSWLTSKEKDYFYVAAFRLAIKPSRMYWVTSGNPDD
jgi:hypothetical protein